MATNRGPLRLPHHDQSRLGPAQEHGQERRRRTNDVIGVSGANNARSDAGGWVLERRFNGGRQIDRGVALFDADVVCDDAVSVDAQIVEVFHATDHPGEQQRVAPVRRSQGRLVAFDFLGQIYDAADA